VSALPFFMVLQLFFVAQHTLNEFLMCGGPSSSLNSYFLKFLKREHVALTGITKAVSLLPLARVEKVFEKEQSSWNVAQSICFEAKIENMWWNLVVRPGILLCPIN
jgi:hypothetical protein